MGAVTSSSTYSTVNGGSANTSSTTNTYQWWDGVVQNTIAYKPNTSQSTTYTSSFSYNALGQLSTAYISDGKSRNVTFTLDEIGQIIRRDETGITVMVHRSPNYWFNREAMVVAAPVGVSAGDMISANGQSPLRLRVFVRD